MKVYSQDGKLFTRDNPIFKGVRWSALGDRRWTRIYLRGDIAHSYYDPVRVRVQATHSLDFNNDGENEVYAWVLIPKVTHYTESFPLTGNKTLAHKWVKPRSETVTLDGVPLQRHVDYVMNYEAGQWSAITLLQGNTITIEYDAASDDSGALPDLSESDVEALAKENAFLEVSAWPVIGLERVPVYIVIGVSPFPVKRGVDLLQYLSLTVDATERVIPFGY